MSCAVLYGDLLMLLVNQLRPYETHTGAAQALAEAWTQRLGQRAGRGFEDRTDAAEAQSAAPSSPILARSNACRERHGAAWA